MGRATNKHIKSKNLIPYWGEPQVPSIDFSGVYIFARFPKLSGWWGWGLNTYGGLGDNSTTSRSSPVSIVGNHDFVSVINGNGTSVALKSDGSVWCWGNGAFGALGDNSATSRSSPVSVVGGHSFTKVLSSFGDADVTNYSSTVYALKSDGIVWSWGTNVNSNLGNGTANTHRSSPVSVWSRVRFSNLVSGYEFAFGHDVQGYAWGWGNGGNGALGTGTTYNRTSAVPVIRFIST